MTREFCNIYDVTTSNVNTMRLDKSNPKQYRYTFTRLDGVTCQKIIVTFLSTDNSVTIILKKFILLQTLQHNDLKLLQNSRKTVLRKYKHPNESVGKNYTPPPKKNPIMLYLRTTPRHENLLFLRYRTTEGMDVIKGIREGEENAR